MRHLQRKRRRLVTLMTARTQPHCCARCGARLAGDNKGDLCRPCQRAAREALVSPPEVPPEFWERQELRNALVNERHIGRAIRSYRTHPHHGSKAIPQDIVAKWLSVSQVHLGRIENGRPVTDLAKLTQWASILRIPSELLWFSMPNQANEGTDSPSLSTRVLIPTGRPLAANPSFEFDPAGVADRISELANWAEISNVGDSGLSYLDGSIMRLASDCLTVSPVQTGYEAETLINRISEILRTGRQRLAQTRDLYVFAGKLCAILSWISSDLGQLAAADAHVLNGLALAGQADHNGLRALLFSARSKNEFWRRRYSAAAASARRGYDFNPSGTLRVLLACQEADALQAMGRIDDAKEALHRSERIQDSLNQSGELGGIFACGIARQANYSIGTYLRAGSPNEALRHVERAEMAWRDGEHWAYGTWAQVQIGASIAHLMNGDIESAAETLREILEQPEERRLATVATRLTRDVTPLLANPAIGRSKSAMMLLDGIVHYERSPIRLLPAEGES